MNSQKTEKILEKNIESIHSVRVAFDEKRSRSERFVDMVTRFFGSTLALYLHLALYGGWLLAICFLLEAGYTDAHIDRISFAASIEAIFLAIFVLINQKRMNSLERRNSDLHLQMSLLMEQKVSDIFRLNERIAAHLKVESAAAHPSEEKGKRPEEIIEKIASMESKIPTQSTK